MATFGDFVFGSLTNAFCLFHTSLSKVARQVVLTAFPASAPPIAGNAHSVTLTTATYLAPLPSLVLRT